MYSGIDQMILKVHHSEVRPQVWHPCSIYYLTYFRWLSRYIANCPVYYCS